MSYGGEREGWEFRLGEDGLGYYALYKFSCTREEGLLKQTRKRLLVFSVCSYNQIKSITYPTLKSASSFAIGHGEAPHGG